MIKSNKYKVNYSSGDGIIEIVIKDSTGRREAKFVANQCDTVQLRRIGAILKSKYGIDLTPGIEKGFFDY